MVFKNFSVFIILFFLFLKLLKYIRKARQSFIREFQIIINFGHEADVIFSGAYKIIFLSYPHYLQVSSRRQLQGLAYLHVGRLNNTALAFREKAS